MNYDLKQVDYKFVYGRADGMPVSPQSIVVWDRNRVIWLLIQYK